MSTPLNEALRLLGRGAQRAFQWYMSNPARMHMINYGVSNLAREYKNARLVYALRSDGNANAAVATLDQNLTDKAKSSLEEVIKNAQRNAGSPRTPDRHGNRQSKTLHATSVTSNHTS